MNRTHLLKFDGISRSVLEVRIAQLVGAIDDLERRLEGRIDLNTQIVSSDAAARIAAYQTALGDLREMVLRIA